MTADAPVSSGGSTRLEHLCWQPRQIDRRYFVFILLHVTTLCFGKDHQGYILPYDRRNEI